MSIAPITIRHNHGIYHVVYNPQGDRVLVPDGGDLSYYERLGFTAQPAVKTAVKTEPIKPKPKKAQATQESENGN